MDGCKPVKTGFAAIGEIMQLAFVPVSFDMALSHWTETMGVRPFFLFEHVRLRKPVYRGERATADFSIAIA